MHSGSEQPRISTSIRLFACTTPSFARSPLIVTPECSTALIRSLACLLTGFRSQGESGFVHASISNNFNPLCVTIASYIRFHINNSDANNMTTTTVTTTTTTTSMALYPDLRAFVESDSALSEVGIRSLYFSSVGTSNREQNQKFELLMGEETIEELLCGMKFRISPGKRVRLRGVVCQYLLDLRAGRN